MPPGLQSTWTHYSVSAQLTGYLSPAHFSEWVTSPPVDAPLSSSHLAAQLLDTFRAKYPWAVLMKGTKPSDPNYGSSLSLVGVTNPSSPLTTTSENVVDSVVFLVLLHDMT